MGKRIQSNEIEAVHKRMGELLCNGRHETTAKEYRRMATPKDKSDILETMEESQNEIPNDKEIWYA